MNPVEKKLYEDIGEDLASIVRFSLIKVGKRNKLGSSNLADSFAFVLNEKGIDIIANSYWKNIEFGSPVGTNVSYGDLYFWAKRYQIKPFNGVSFNTMIWLIKAAIRRNGIKARPFVESALHIADVNVNVFLDEFTSKSINSAFEDFSK